MKAGKLNPEQLERVSTALASVPFARHLGIELEEIDAGTATLGFEIKPELKQNHGVVHGGAIASLIDSATAFAIISLLPPDEHATTVDLTISYLRPLTKGRARAVGGEQLRPEEQEAEPARDGEPEVEQPGRPGGANKRVHRGSLGGPAD